MSMDTVDADGPGGSAASPAHRAVMNLLAQHVPLSLLLDVLVADGPCSREILETEGVPPWAWWAPEAG